MSVKTVELAGRDTDAFATGTSACYCRYWLNSYHYRLLIPCFLITLILSSYLESSVACVCVLFIDPLPAK